MGRKKKEIQIYFSMSSRRKERPGNEKKNTIYCQGGRESTIIRMMYLKLHGSSYQKVTVLQEL